MNRAVLSWFGGFGLMVILTWGLLSVVNMKPVVVDVLAGWVGAVLLALLGVLFEKIAMRGVCGWRVFWGVHTRFFRMAMGLVMIPLYVKVSGGDMMLFALSLVSGYLAFLCREVYILSVGGINSHGINE